MARKKSKTMRSRYDAWLLAHNGAACAIVFTAVLASLLGLFCFVVFSGFGSSSDFIYNQF